MVCVLKQIVPRLCVVLRLDDARLAVAVERKNEHGFFEGLGGNAFPLTAVAAVFVIVVFTSQLQSNGLLLSDDSDASSLKNIGFDEGSADALIFLKGLAAEACADSAARRFRRMPQRHALTAAEMFFLR